MALRCSICIFICFAGVLAGGRVIKGSGGHDPFLSSDGLECNKQPTISTNSLIQLNSIVWLRTEILESDLG